MRRILLVNPPIYDFAAYDFWLKPYGLLSVAGQLRGQAEFFLFDYLEQGQGDCGLRITDCGLASDGFFNSKSAIRNRQLKDRWGRGTLYHERIESPAPLKNIPRYFRRFGRPRSVFTSYLKEQGPFDFVLIQTMMTYWYPGVREVIEDIRSVWPSARIVLGGNYATLCPDHARGLGADLVVVGSDLQPLWEFLEMTSNPNEPTLWEVAGANDHSPLRVGALKLADGCPFRCSYCSVPKVYGGFRPRPSERSLAELELLVARGAENVAFYDDALLFDAEHVLIPFLTEILRRGLRVNLHTPNALNARFLSAELAQLMVRAGFKTFYLGFESAARQ